MADAAVSFLLENVRELATYYADLISSEKYELEKLNDELSLLKAFLKDVGAAKKWKHDDEVFRVIERQIRDVVYEAEDTIDTCLSQTVAARKRNIFSRSLNRSKHINLAKEVKFLREKVMSIFDTARTHFLNMSIGDGSAGTSIEQPSMKLKKVPLIREDNVIGLKDAEETLINYLNEETDELDVISVVGMPGLGKTTLAWKIFQSPKTRYEFPTRIWIYVSQEFNRKDVFLRILKQLTNQDMSDMSDLELALTVRGYLETGKFLLILDDVWTVEAWNDIQDAFTKSNSRGKVLITSRSMQVAARANVRREPCILRFLTEEQSWELLQLEVFGKLENCPMELVEIGRYIAKQCDGLPLAVVVIGNILSDKLSTTRTTGGVINAWKNVSGDVSAHIKNDKGHSISEIVAMSYNNLPGDLRDCFIYLGVFPEDYVISASTLTRLWIAEGFIQQKEGQNLEETAEDFLDELINRNLVMVDKINPSGKVKTCRVHDVIREFCNSKAAIGEHNLFQEIKLTNHGDFNPPISDLKKYRRLCIHVHLLNFLSERLKGLRVRSFLCFCKDTIILTPNLISTIPDAFNLLRVLESKSFRFNQFPTKVASLIHLRYLTLSCDDLHSLPESICELWNLQTLTVDTNSRTLTFRASIWKMVQLRHLNTKASIVLSKKVERKTEGKAGENLQTLSRLSPECCTDDVLNKARNLKKLGIRGRLATLLDNSRSLDKLDHLENLKLLNDLFYESAFENPLHGLPRPNWFPPNLKMLTLSGTDLEWKHMYTLGRISTLQVLKLKDNAFTGDTWTCTDSGGFPNLQFLLIVTTDLIYWTASDDYFPTLKCLVLKNCERLSQIPSALAKSLQLLDIDRVSKSAANSAREIEREKKDMKGQEKGRWGGFKLSMGPGCE